MKRILVFLAASLTVISCSQGLNEENNPVRTSVQIEKTLTVDPALCNASLESKTVYEPGTGIKWSGNENIVVYYAPNLGGEALPEGEKYMRVASQVKKTSENQYTVTHDAITINGNDVQFYDYHFLVAERFGTTGDGRASRYDLFPLQFPTSGSYDPDYDMLVGQSQVGVSKTESLKIDKFKRMTYPLKITVKDSKNLLETSTIKSVTISFSALASGTGNSLSGMFFVHHSDVFEECDYNTGDEFSNTLTAVYPAGLTKEDDGYPVWFMVNPVSFASGTEMTLTVVSDNKTIIRKVTVGNDLTVEVDKVNKLTFDISKDNYKTNDTQWINVLSSDGIALPETISAEGKIVDKIYLYTHPGNTTEEAVISLDGSGNTYDFSNDGTLVKTNGGVVEISVPADLQTEGNILKLTSDNDAVLLSGVRVQTTDKVVDENDYLALYEAGKDIEINGKTYNKTTHPTYQTITPDNLTGFNYDGIVFIDNADQKDPVTISTTIVKSPVIIGRYRDNQPEIIVAAPIRCRNNGEKVFKNLKITSTDPTSMFDNGGTPSNTSIVVEDCELDASDSKLVINDNKPDYSFESVSIRNSVIKLSATVADASLYCINKEKTASYDAIKKIDIVNNAIYSENVNEKSYIINTNNQAINTTDMVLNVEKNTFYNIFNFLGIVNVYTASKMSVINNIGVFDGSANRSFLAGSGSDMTGKNEIDYNYLAVLNSGTGSWRFVKGTGLVQGSKNKNGTNLLDSSSNPTMGYFPSTNISIGADYDTKKWKDWNAVTAQ